MRNRPPAAVKKALIIPDARNVSFNLYDSVINMENLVVRKCYICI